MLRQQAKSSHKFTKMCTDLSIEPQKKKKKNSSVQIFKWGIFENSAQMESFRHLILLSFLFCFLISQRNQVRIKKQATRKGVPLLAIWSPRRESESEHEGGGCEEKQIKSGEGRKIFSAPISLIKFVSWAGRTEISSCYSVCLCLITVNLPRSPTMPQAYDVWHAVNSPLPLAVEWRGKRHTHPLSLLEALWLY